MKCQVKLWFSGNTFKEEVIAKDYRDAKQTAEARNPKARVIAVDPRP